MKIALCFSGQARSFEKGYEYYKRNLLDHYDVDSALADIIAYNAADSIDAVVAAVLTGGSNVIYAGTATTTNTITSSMTISTSDIRQAVVELRTNKALPRIGELYAAYLHPRQSADLRAESGTGGFQELTKYVERTPFTAGAVGVLEGAFIVETPRVPFAANSGSVNVLLIVLTLNISITLYFLHFIFNTTPTLNNQLTNNQ